MYWREYLLGYRFRGSLYVRGISSGSVLQLFKGDRIEALKDNVGLDSFTVRVLCGGRWIEWVVDYPASS